MEIRAGPQGLIFFTKKSESEKKCGRNFIADI